MNGLPRGQLIRLMKRKLPEPYSVADRMIKMLSLKILEETNRAKRKLSVLGFDELNVLRETDALYAKIESECRKAIWNVYYMRYSELWIWLNGNRPNEDMIDELVDMYVAGIWEIPNETTHYAFQPELIRKRDRAQEAIRSVPTKTQKQIELDKARQFVVQQSTWYLDFASQDAEIQAFKDAGVKKVQRHEMNDDKVCAVCREADGKIYDIGKIPPLPHLRCRRWFLPYG